MKHRLAIALLLSAIPAAALAQDIMPMLPSDERIKVLPYDENDVYTVTTRYGYQTNIVFGQAEEIQTISVGDRSLWQIVPAGNRLFIRPMDEGVTTNMTVLTNRHSYQFDLKSVAADSKSGGNIYVAKFMYPDATAKPALPPGTQTVVYTPARSSDPGITSPVHPNYNYSYTGPDDLAPYEVYDDGKSTFIRYRTPPKPLPAIYILEASGREKPVTYESHNGLLVVDAVVPELKIKSSAGALQVYNDMISSR